MKSVALIASLVISFSKPATARYGLLRVENGVRTATAAHVDHNNNNNNAASPTQRVLMEEDFNL
jgi:hypothetical protein